MTRKVRNSHFAAISSKKLLQYQNDFIKELFRRNAETRGTYVRSLREFFRWKTSQRHFSFKPSEIERYKSYLLGKKKLSAASVTTYISALRQFCKHLVQRRALQQNPVVGIKWVPRDPQHTRATLTSGHVQTILHSVERIDERGFRDYAIITLMAMCGLSEIELVRADISDVKNTSHKMSVQLQGKGKKSKDTVLPLPTEAREALLGYLVFRKDAESTEPLFMSAGNRTRGERMTSRGIRERINMYMKKAGVKQLQGKHVTPLSLRHTAIDLLAQTGATVEELQSKFGIRTETTAKLYLKRQQSSTP